MVNRYEVTIYWSDDDGCFVAEVPELPGCMADGGTYQEAAAKAEEAIAEWIATASELGRVVPVPRRRVQHA
jgi:predicted RNase H-like HicB family nuclease